MPKVMIRDVILRDVRAVSALAQKSGAGATEVVVARRVVIDAVRC